MARTQDPKIGKPLYAKKGATVLYYKDEALTKQELGMSAKDGNLIGTYVRTTSTSRESGVQVYGIYWPSDPSDPVRYIRAALAEWTSYKKDGNIPATVDLTNYDPAKDTKNRQVAKQDYTVYLLAIGLAAAIAYKFGPRS